MLSKINAKKKHELAKIAYSLMQKVSKRMMMMRAFVLYAAAAAAATANNNVHVCWHLHLHRTACTIMFRTREMCVTSS